MPETETGWQPMLRIIGLLAAIFALSLTVRMAWVSHEQLELAHKAEQAGNWQRAIVHHERAIHPYLPLLPDRMQAIRDMQALCTRLEKTGNKMLALEGWRRLRGALLAARSMFGQPDRDVLNVANREIARLTAETDTQGMMPKAEIQRETERLLQNNPRDVHPFWGAMQFFLLAFWIVATGRLIWRWPHRAWSHRLTALAVAGAAFAGWLGSLYLAG